MTSIRRICFISYHHDDQREVDQFIRAFDHERDIFIARGLGQEMSQDVIDSNDTEYVMRRIRESFLRSSTVTIVLMGKCTWARRYVDWELQASLRTGYTVIPNGLLGIRLPSFNTSTPYPQRLSYNLKRTAEQEDSYARVMDYPTRKEVLAEEIERAFQRRLTHLKWLCNPRERFKHNKRCS